MTTRLHEAPIVDAEMSVVRDVAGGSLTKRYGSAKHPERPVEKPRVPQLDDATVRALGILSEALEVVENARGHLYEFHRMTGTADLRLQDAVHELRSAGQAALADDIDEVLVGRDVVPGMWTFQLVESYDEHYWTVFRAVDQLARDRLAGGTRHVYEAEMKLREQARRGTSPGSAVTAR
jgi:hypothetical protein